MTAKEVKDWYSKKIIAHELAEEVASLLINRTTYTRKIQNQNPIVRKNLITVLDIIGITFVIVDF